MIYEFALEPELVAQWCERKEYLFFDEKFGLRSRRIVSAYPKKWKKLVWAAFSGGAFANDQNAQMRMTELVQYLWQNSIKRLSTFSENIVWLERAEAEHAERPFYAILATDNPRKRSFVIAANDLIENGHDLWRIPDQNPTTRTPEDIAGTLSSVLQTCRHAILVDPYFNPRKRRFLRTLEAILQSCCGNICGVDKLQVELHTSIDREFNSWERGEDRNTEDDRIEYEKLETACKNLLPDIIPDSIALRIVIWKQRVNGEKLHNRYLLTNLFSVMFGTGSDASDNPATNESDDFVLLEEGQHITRYQQYAGNQPAFDMVGAPFKIIGKKL